MMENGTRIFLAELINASIYNKTISEVPAGFLLEENDEEVIEVEEDDFDDDFFEEDDTDEV